MELEKLRQEISRIDDEMAELFIRRMKAAAGIAEAKRERGLAVEDKEQEKKVVEGHLDKVDDPEMKEYYVRFIRDVMDVSKSWQHKLLEGQKIAFRGAEGSGDHDAAKQGFPTGLLTAYPTYEEAYAAVADGTCDIAVLPFENGLGGEVGKVIDLIFSGDLFVNSVYSVEEGQDISRYAVLSRAEKETGAENGAFLLMFTVQDETGSLAKAINIISAFDFNMRVMRSRPLRDLPWHYYFYAEVVGDDTSDNGRRMLNAMNVVCPSVKVAGRYAIQQ